MAPSVLIPESLSFRQASFHKFPATEDLVPDTLNGWPMHLDNTLSWDGSTFCSEDEYTYTLTEHDKDEIRRALTFFKDLGIDGNEVKKSNFPLPALQEKLQELSLQLHDTLGFFVLRGLDPNEYSPEDNIILFLGISSYIGEKRGRQDDAGNMLMHICEAKKMTVLQEFRPARDSNTSLKFHSDLYCDILALQTRGCAAVGGNHIITPTYKIYNELMMKRPDLVEVLARSEWCFDPRSLHAKPEQRPLLFHHDGHVILNFGRNRLLGTDDPDCRRLNGIPTVSPLQMEALELVQELGEKYQLELPMQLGDLTFINNFGILHSRDAFEDSGTRVRYLVRMWIQNTALSWKLPKELESGNHATYDDAAEQIWNILPAPRVKFDVRDRFSP